MRNISDSFRRLCFNPKVIGALILVGVGVFVFAPNLASRVLPLLFVAACPLSMLLMGKAMSGHHESAETAAPSQPPAAALPSVGEQGSSDELASLRAEVEELRAQIEDGHVKNRDPAVEKSRTLDRPV